MKKWLLRLASQAHVCAPLERTTPLRCAAEVLCAHLRREVTQGLGLPDSHVTPLFWCRCGWAEGHSGAWDSLRPWPPSERRDSSVTCHRPGATGTNVTTGPHLRSNVGPSQLENPSLKLTYATHFCVHAIRDRFQRDSQEHSAMPHTCVWHF